MVVCLCNDVRSDNGFKRSPEASQYWPTDDEPVMTFTYNNTITVTLLESQPVNEYLKASKLHVKSISKDGEVLGKAEVDHFHFSGWPDLRVPEQGDPRNGFNAMMIHLVKFYTDSSLPN